MQWTYRQRPPYRLILKPWNRITTLISANVSTTAPNGLSNETPIVKNDSPSEDFDVPGWPSAGRPSDSCRHTRSPGKRPGQRSAQKAVIQELRSALNETMFKTLTLLRYSVQGISNFITLILVGTRCRRTRVRQHNCAHKTQNGKMLKRSAEGSAESTKWGQIVSPGPPRAQNGGKLCSRRTRILNILFQFLDTIWSMRTDTKAFCVLGGPDAKVTQNTLG